VTLIRNSNNIQQDRYLIKKNSCNQYFPWQQQQEPTGVDEQSNKYNKQNAILT
jgi:hypothetical protein